MFGAFTRNGKIYMYIKANTHPYDFATNLTPREQWLWEQDATEGDVRENEFGEEYVLTQVEVGKPEDKGYKLYNKTVHLPRKLQNKHYPLP